VVKGPQNALYGRTAFAGAINYITRKPSDELGGEVYTDIGDNGRYLLRGNVSGPLKEGVLFGGLNAAVWTDDGHYSNSVTGADVGGAEGWGLAGSLRWNASDRFTANARVEYTDDEFEQAPYTAITPTVPVPLPASALGTVIAPSVTEIASVVGTIPAGDSLAVTLSENPRTGADYPGTERELLRASLHLDYDVGPVSLMSLTGFTDGDTFSFEDSRREGSVAAAGKTTGSEFWVTEETQVFSQELRVLSNTDGPVSWVVGGLYWDESVDFVDGTVNCIANELFSPFPPPGGIVPGANCAAPIAAISGASRFGDPWKRDTEHWSVYGLVDWEFVENVSIALEARYGDEKITVTGPERDGVTSPRAIDPRGILFPMALVSATGSITDSVSDDFFAPKATLQWEPADDRMYYLSWAQAIKPAGISVVAALSGFDPDTSKFDQEKLQVWELGAKTMLLDGRVMLNGAFFYQDFSDKQVTSQILDPGGSGLLVTAPVNASSAEIIGLELDTRWWVTDEFQLYAQYTYMTSEYDEYKQLTSGPAPISEAGNCTPVTLGTPPSTRCEIDLSGRDLEHVPEHSLVAGAEYRRQINRGLEWSFGANYIFQDERFTNATNTVNLDSYSLWDFRLGLAGDQWQVQGYVDNAFDDDTVKSALANSYLQGLSVAAPPFTFVLPSNQMPILPDGREIGIRASYWFGGN
jgi:outer membrane receptor protein involved in Fe transport